MPYGIASHNLEYIQKALQNMRRLNNHNEIIGESWNLALNLIIRIDSGSQTVSIDYIVEERGFNDEAS